MKKEVKTKKMTIDKLAIMVAKGFEGIEAKMATKEDIKDMATKTDIEKLTKRIDDLAETKVSKIIYKELDNRVGFIEKKLEI